MKNFIQNVFSVTNVGNHKIITILGVKLKFKHKTTVRIDDFTLLKLKSFFNNNVIKIDTDTLKSIEKFIDNGLSKFFDYKTGCSKPPITTKDFIDISELKEVVEIISCPFCKSSHFHPIREFNINSLVEKYKDVYKIDPIGSVYKDKILYKYHCDDCGLEFYNYYIPDSSVFYEKLLESGRYRYPKYKWEYDKAIDIIKKYNCKKVLDIGCGYGFFLEKLQNITDYTLGMEFNSKAIEECKKKNLNVTDAKLDEIDEKFDCICLFQVLEHIHDPKTFLEQIINLLEENGVLFIGTPNPEGLWIKSNPDILNLPPHHCLDVTQEFYENIPKYFNLTMMDYFQDEPEFGLYQNYYLPTKVNKQILFTNRANLYGYYLQEKNHLKGHRHICVYQRR